MVENSDSAECLRLHRRPIILQYPQVANDRVTPALRGSCG
jgi:hypothetical protein